jgi:phosphatidylserine/phosphatidylglycerophosphate/cardiolipin synthase-like enzyme
VQLLDAILKLVEDVPQATVVSLAHAIGGSITGDWPDIRTRAQSAVANPHYREQAGHLVDVWHRHAPEFAPASIALALQASAHSVSATRNAQTLDLVWTGPHGGTTRRTDQALLELINGAQRNLLVVTFAAYKVSGIREALGKAIERGVQLSIVIESPLESEGKVAYDGLAALGPSIAERARIHRWPLEARPVDDTGRHGSLHVKCAVADERTLLISSANLTAHAFTLNMELGLVVTGGSLPRQVTQHFAALIQANVLVKV